MAELHEVTDQNFEAEILQSDRPAVVDFWAEWCAPCRAIAPILKDLAGTYGDRVKIVKMNVDENPSTPAKYDVRSIPTVLAFSKGQVVEQIIGVRRDARSSFEEMVKKLVD